MPRQYSFPDLNASVRTKMIAEVEHDIAEDVLYLSKNFSEEGKAAYPKKLKNAVREHDEWWLGEQLEGAFHAHDSAGRAVRYDMNFFFAGNEFNRFYIRGVCLVAIDKSHDGVEVYRARQSSRARAESEAMIGEVLDPLALLHDLRKHIGATPDLLPQIGSGLSVRLSQSNQGAE